MSKLTVNRLWTKALSVETSEHRLVSRDVMKCTLLRSVSHVWGMCTVFRSCRFRSNAVQCINVGRRGLMSSATFNQSVNLYLSKMVNTA